MKQAMRAVVEERAFAVAVLSVAIGVSLWLTMPFPEQNVFLQYVAIQRQPFYSFVRWSYTAFLFTTPFLLLSAISSLGYIHFSRRAINGDYRLPYGAQAATRIHAPGE